MTARKKPARLTENRGTKAKPDNRALQSPLKSRILALAATAAAKSQDVRRVASEAVKAAHECGKLLLAEKAWLLEIRDEAREKIKLLRENNQQATDREIFWRDADWNTWFASQYEKEIPLDAAERYTRLAKAHENQTTFAFDSAPNVLRSGLLALRIYPRKEHQAIPGDAPLSPIATHLALVNRFVLWLDGWKRKRKGPLTLDERARLLSDFGPVASFIEELRRTR